MPIRMVKRKKNLIISNVDMDVELSFIVGGNKKWH